jgi:putative transposase
MGYALFDGRPFRILTVVDCHSREPFAIVPRMYFQACELVEVLDRLFGERSKPKTLRCGSGPSFAGQRCQSTLA